MIVRVWSTPAVSRRSASRTDDSVISEPAVVVEAEPSSLDAAPVGSALDHVPGRFEVGVELVQDPFVLVEGRVGLEGVVPPRAEEPVALPHHDRPRLDRFGRHQAVGLSRRVLRDGDLGGGDRATRRPGEGHLVGITTELAGVLERERGRARRARILEKGELGPRRC